MQIVAQRFFSGASGGPGDAGSVRLALPPFYQQLLEVFLTFREQHEDELHYRPGTSELIDWTAALRSRDVPEAGELRELLPLVRKTASAVSKNKEDHAALRTYLDGLGPKPA